MNELVADTVSNYNGLQASLQKRLSAGWMFGASYTYSKALSEADTDAASVLDSTPNFSPIINSPGHDYGLSAFGQKHILVLNSLYQMPWDHLLNGRVEKALLGGWAVNGIWQYGSGLPLNVNLAFNNSLTGDPDAGGDRPNLVTGFSNNPTSGVTAGCAGIPAGQKLHTPDLWFNPCAFSLPKAGTFGNLGRNTVIGPAFDVVNFTLVKNTVLAERGETGVSSRVLQPAESSQLRASEQSLIQREWDSCRRRGRSYLWCLARAGDTVRAEVDVLSD